MFREGISEARYQFVCATCRRPVDIDGHHFFTLVNLRLPLCCDGALAVQFPQDPPATVELRRVVIRSNAPSPK